MRAQRNQWWATLKRGYKGTLTPNTLRGRNRGIGAASPRIASCSSRVLFKTRIELRQIGVRDEAKMVGGLGPCGRPLCCSTFLGEFAPVSIKMAKEQNLSLNPSKISVICGRLMCCLTYEEEAYRKIREKMPNVGSIVETDSGKGDRKSTRLN